VGEIERGALPRDYGREPLDESLLLPANELMQVARLNQKHFGRIDKSAVHMYLLGLTVAAGTGRAGG
jgi:hypothetical protein